MIKKEILTELRRGTPIGEIKRKYRSMSQVYEALREFSEENGNAAEEMRASLGKVKLELETGRAQLEKVEKEKCIVEIEAVKAKQTLAGLRVETESANKKLHSLQVDAGELETRGIPHEIVKKIMAVEAKSGSELLSKVETAEKYVGLKSETDRLEEEKKQLSKGISALENRKQSIEHLTVSETNKLDQMKMQTLTYKEATDAVQALFKIGYNPADIESMAHGLQAFGIKDSPKASVTRLINGLDRMKTLLTLEESNKKAEAKLTMLTDLANRAKSELETIKQVVLTKFNDAADTAVQAITRAGEQTNAQMLQTAKSCQSESNEIAELEHRKGELEGILGPYKELAGILKSPECLKNTPIDVILQLLRKIQEWCEMNLPDYQVKPSEKIQAKEFNLKPYYSYELSAIIELALMGLKQQVKGQVSTKLIARN